MQMCTDPLRVALLCVVLLRDWYVVDDSTELLVEVCVCAFMRLFDGVSPCAPGPICDACVLLAQAKYYESLACGLIANMEGVVLTRENKLLEQRDDPAGGTPAPHMSNVVDAAMAGLMATPVFAKKAAASERSWKFSEISHNHVAWWLFSPSDPCFAIVDLVCKVP